MFCLSCHQKHALEKAGWAAEYVCAEMPHQQFVFTIPKRLRIYFRSERRLLGELCRAAARTVITVYRAASGRPDAVPGMVGAIQTFGQLVIERILRHCGLWEKPSTRAPPTAKIPIEG